MIRGGKARDAARLLCAAACCLACAAPAFAQQDGGTLDPSAPLAPLPDLGVAWPDLDVSDEPIAALPLEPGQAAEAAPAPVPISDEPGALRYTVRLDGLEPTGLATELATAFDAQSVLVAERKSAANAAQVERRSRADAELLAELLRSQGFYDAAVEPRIARSGGALLVLLEASPGTRYRFASISLPGLPSAGSEAESLRASFAVAEGDPVVAGDVIAAGIALKVALGEQGFALAQVGEQAVEIDHQAHTATLVLPVQPGPLASFGAIRVSGSPPFSAAHVARIARFGPGETFRRSRVDDLRRALIATGLVSSAEVRVLPGATGRTVDLAVDLQPAPLRTIAGELGYGTGEGVRAEASWQHRNLINPEGAVTLRGVAGTQEQLAAVQFRRNNFLRRDQILNLQLSASNTDREAYEAKSVLLSGNIERQSNIIWHKKWTWSYGADLLATRERGVFDLTQAKSTKDFLIAALPVSLGYDDSDDLLDPTSGLRLLGRVSPEISSRNGSFTYGRAQFDASVYRQVTGRAVLAGRIRLGTIVGAALTELAPSRRFYSGGGGSVRGYGYQTLGPRDEDGDPIGGRGLAEFALEARYRLNVLGGNFGIVPFLDGGTLTDKGTPSLSGWQLGAGLGLRYYSSFGPIRIDVGTPLNPRQGDSRIAVTVSLGQAF